MAPPNRRFEAYHKKNKTKSHFHEFQKKIIDEGCAMLDDREIKQVAELVTMFIDSKAGNKNRSRRANPVPAPAHQFHQPQNPIGAWCMVSGWMPGVPPYGVPPHPHWGPGEIATQAGNIEEMESATQDSRNVE